MDSKFVDYFCRCTVFVFHVQNLLINFFWHQDNKRSLR